MTRPGCRDVDLRSIVKFNPTRLLTTFDLLRDNRSDGISSIYSRIEIGFPVGDGHRGFGVATLFA